MAGFEVTPEDFMAQIKSTQRLVEVPRHHSKNSFQSRT
jgi:hypothetical protein